MPCRRRGAFTVQVGSHGLDCRRNCGARLLACTNMIENVMGTVRRVCRNVKRWRSAWMAMRWTAAAMQEAAKGFRRLKAHKQLPALRAALEAHQTRHSAPRRACSPSQRSLTLISAATASQCSTKSGTSAMLARLPDHPAKGIDQLSRGCHNARIVWCSMVPCRKGLSIMRKPRQ
jgi:hypothetical protein